MNAITPVSHQGLAAGSISPLKNREVSTEEFSNVFKGFLSQTNEDQIVSEQAVTDLVTGKSDNVQDVVLAVAKAEMSFQLFMEIRNKLIESYNELMRMQF